MLGMSRNQYQPAVLKYMTEKGASGLSEQI